MWLFDIPTIIELNRTLDRYCGSCKYYKDKSGK